MESPYNGRAIIDDDINGMVITIPSKKNWLIIIFVGFWLFMWSIGIISILSISLFGNNGGEHLPPAALLLMLCFWAAFMIIPLRMFLWNIIGKEVISIDTEVLTIDIKGLLFSRPKSYDLSEAQNFRVQEDNLGMMSPFGIRPGSLLKMGSSGTIRFDYGLQTVKFADNMDEVEANFILGKFKSKKLVGSDQT